MLFYFQRLSQDSINIKEERKKRHLISVGFYYLLSHGIAFKMKYTERKIV